MQENKILPNKLEVGPCRIIWNWEEPTLVDCTVWYEEPGTVGFKLIGDHWARCSEEDIKAGLFSERKGMQVSLKKAMSKTHGVLTSHSFRQKIWFTFRDEIGFHVPNRCIRSDQLPKDIIGHSFTYKKEVYTVTNIVWGKAPRAKNPDRGYWKKGEQPGKRMWVEYVEYEPDHGMQQRFVRPKAEFLNKFRYHQRVEKVKVIEDFPDSVDPTPQTGFINFE